MNQLISNPELSLDFNLLPNSPFKPNTGIKFPVSWGVVMAVFAILLMFYWAGKLGNKDTEPSKLEEKK